MYKYEYYEDASNKENKAELLIHDSNYTINDTNSTSLRKGSITGIAEAIRLSVLDFVLLIWIITFITDEIQQVKFEFNISVHLIYTFIN